MDNTWFRKTVKKSILLSCVALTFVLLIKILVPVGESKDKLSEIFLAQPAFAQQATTFPSDEAGISAYVNVGQGIDLAKAESALRGIQAEGDNYVIGIVELSGLPEEEFPHMYVSSDGWILAYYSKFAPASRIMHWGKYGGGNINTNTLYDAISKICSTTGIYFAQVRGNIGYYHFNYPDASKVMMAVERVEEDKIDTFSFSIPYDVTLYEASWSHYFTGHGETRSWYGNQSDLRIDGDRRASRLQTKEPSLDCGYFEEREVTQGGLHSAELSAGYAADWAGVAAVFIYR